MDNIFDLAYQCLAASNLEDKLTLSSTATEKIFEGNVNFYKQEKIIELVEPGRPDKPVLIPPKDVPRRKIKSDEGKAAMVHAFAHIEFNAINLAWDLIYRFQDMPVEFYQDWAHVAAEETKHFKLLQNNLKDMQYDYGDFPAHDGLWTIAEKTKHDILLRLAVVPRIMEARGLDVTPSLIERFRNIGDDKIVDILEIIYEEEIGHVNLGSKWYSYICNKRQQKPEETFKNIIKEFLPSVKTKKINHEARLMAGFTKAELDCLEKI